MHQIFGQISKSGVPAAAIVLSAVLVLVTPIMSLSAATTAVFTVVTGISSDMYLIVYTLAMLAHRKYRLSNDYLADGFKMPAYRITSPLTIAFFVLIFASLFFIQADIVGAIGAIIWTLLFGGITFAHQARLRAVTRS